ncbi:reverse transcriptase domain-containing protein [Tanacetum coccineum]
MFEAAEGMFLGYMISPEGIKPCPDKTEAVLQLPSPQTIKEVQSLNGKLASLNRFLSKSMEKSLPLFKTLKKCIKKCSFNDRKRHSPDTGLFREPSAASSQDKLYPDGKASPGSSLRRQKVTRIVLGASHYGHHRPAHQASDITSRRQILADFLVEKPDDAPPEASVIETLQVPRTLFTDGSSCVDGSGAGLILTSPEGTEFTYALRFQFATSNNEAEYEALIAGLRIAARMGVRNILVSVDSKLVENQVLGTYIAKEENMIRYLEKTKSPISGINSFSISQRDETLLNDRKEASKLRIKARQYKLLEEILYKHSFLKPWLRCVGPLQADYVIREIHEGSCSMHAGLRSVVAKAMRFGYYWPTMHRDAREIIRKCKDCQIHRPVPRHSTNGGLTSLVLSRKGQGRTKAVIPAKIGMPTYRTVVVDAVHNDEELRLNLDLLEKRRERAVIRKAKAKSNMTKYYNARVRCVTFRPGDFVYRSNNASHAVDGGKLGPKWEGPYEVTEALGDGAYKLRSTNGMVLPRTWSIANLKKCYL